MEPDLLPAYIAGRAYIRWQVDRWLRRQKILISFDDAINDLLNSDALHKITLYHYDMGEYIDRR